MAGGRAGINGRFFYNDAMNGMNFRRVRGTFADALTLLLRHVADPAPPALALQALSISAHLPRFDLQHRLDLPPPGTQATMWIGNASTVAAHLELDARTGKSILQFGTNGLVDLRAGLGRDPESLTLVQSSTPGRIFENLIILGSATNEEYESGPGDVRAYDVLSGRLVWTFHTVPHPGEFGYDTWPKDAWKTVGGANAWSGLSLDVKRGVLYVPTASPKYNFYGANRAGANLFGDCLLAINARTGKLIWHFQMVHHDIWDYDNGTAPKLLTVRHDGKMVDVVAQAGKEGFVWVFNRDTGKPLWPIEERAVPHSDMPGEETWPTQPFPLQPPPFARQSFTAKDLSPFMPAEERAHFREEIESARNQGLFTPPGLQNTIEMPGNNGGANFGGAAVDPRQGFLYVVSKDLPAMLKLELDEAEDASASSSPEQRGRAVFATNCRLCHGADLKGEPPAVPSLVDIGSRHTAQEIRAIVRQGDGRMPAFSRLSDAALDSLLAYLSHPERAPAPAASPEQRGRLPQPWEQRMPGIRAALASCLRVAGFPRLPRPGPRLRHTI